MKLFNDPEQVQELKEKLEGFVVPEFNAFILDNEFRPEKIELYNALPSEQRDEGEPLPADAPVAIFSRNQEGQLGRCA